MIGRLVLLGILLCSAADSTLTSLRASLASNPNDFTLNWRLAAELTKQGDHASALDRIGVCLRARPRDDDAWAELARLRALLKPEPSRPAPPAAWEPPQQMKRAEWVPTSQEYTTMYGDRRCGCHQQARAALDGYNGFFEHISIRKGWRKAPFEPADLKRVFELSSQVVGFLRARQDSLGLGMTLRQVAGSSHEFLWGLEKNPRVDLPGQDLVYVLRTVEQLVLATLSDKNGLVEGLREELVLKSVHAHPDIKPLVSR